VHALARFKLIDNFKYLTILQIKTAAIKEKKNSCKNLFFTDVISTIPKSIFN